MDEIGHSMTILQYVLVKKEPDVFCKLCKSFINKMIIFFNSPWWLNPRLNHWTIAVLLGMRPAKTLDEGISLILEQQRATMAEPSSDLQRQLEVHA